MHDLRLQLATETPDLARTPQHRGHVCGGFRQRQPELHDRAFDRG